MTVVFIDEPSPVQNAAPPAPLALGSRRMTAPTPPLVVMSPDPSSVAPSVTPGSDDTQDNLAAASAAEHARLYGRYLGQVRARIERAWLRPRTEIGAPRFSCQVRIQQDRQGSVVDVRLFRCNGTDRWQQSLISTIHIASPMPAPPDPSVYADVLWLSFTSEAFQPGDSRQGFEPAVQQDARQEGALSVLESFVKFANESGGDLMSADQKRSKVVHLTIIGSPRAPAPAGLPDPGLPADPRNPEVPR